jgi:hypothetical protein
MAERSEISLSIAALKKSGSEDGKLGDFALPFLHVMPSLEQKG